MFDNNYKGYVYRKRTLVSVR